VLAAIGYPDSYQKGIELNLKPPENDTLKVFHSGTKSENGKIISTGGRILSVSSFAPSLEESVSLSYKYLLSNPVQGTFYRKDIAHRAIIKK
jgi:phosphoribosylamine-glycine ligase